MPAKPRTFTITARDLAALLKPALALAGTDDMLPVLCAVRLEARGSTLTATATDRFRAGIVRHVLDADPDTGTKATPAKPQKAPGAFAVTLPASAVKLALATFRPGHARLARRVRVTVRADQTTVETHGSWEWPAQMTLNLPHQEGTFPDIRSIILKAHAYEGAPPAGGTGVNPAYLASFNAAQRDRGVGMQVRLGPEPGSPIALSCGDHFLGLLMPRRLYNAEGKPVTGLAPEWAALLTSDTKTDKAA